jgi:pyridoxine 5'-phosphate synthase PdxJ
VLTSDSNKAAAHSKGQLEDIFAELSRIRDMATCANTLDIEVQAGHGRLVTQKEHQGFLQLLYLH